MNIDDLMTELNDARLTAKANGQASASRDYEQSKAVRTVRQATDKRY